MPLLERARVLQEARDDPERRWLWLPLATAADTSAPDDWRFPFGTKLYHGAVDLPLVEW